MEKPDWWCPECSSPRYDLCDCDCGHQYQNTWRCSVCGTIVTEYECQSCGRTKAANIHSDRLASFLSAECSESTGRTVLEELVRRARRMGTRRNIPEQVIEEATGKALLRLLEGMSTYSTTKGDFLHWATKIVLNEILTHARDDATRAGKIVFSMDDETEDGTPLHELFASKEDALITEAEYERMLSGLGPVTVLRSLAQIALGSYLDEREQEHSLYDACLLAFSETNGVGWMSQASARTGLPVYTISRRVSAGRDMYIRWVNSGGAKE